METEGYYLAAGVRIRVPMREFAFSFARSGGPGGQNVNKVATKVVLRWNVYGGSGMSEAARARFISRFGNRLTDGGELVISSDRYRSQARNRQDCLDRLREMLEQVASPPKPRLKTRPGKAAKARARKKREAHSRKKAARRERPSFD